MRFIQCDLEHHGQAILDIFNDAIVHSTAVYEYRPRTMDYMHDWFAAKTAGHFPVIGAEDEQQQLLGFATYGVFRARPAYKYSVEPTVYVHKNSRGRGLGTALLKELISIAVKQNYHLMVGGIDAENHISIALHEKLGFAHAGTIKQAGFKFGRWLDLVFYQLLLSTPSDPVDG